MGDSYRKDRSSGGELSLGSRQLPVNSGRDDSGTRPEFSFGARMDLEPAGIELEIG